MNQPDSINTSDSYPPELDWLFDEQYPDGYDADEEPDPFGADEGSSPAGWRCPER